MLHKRITLTVLIFLFCLCSASFAAEMNYYSTYHAHFGDKLFKEGKTEQAINQFVKSIIFFPQQALSRNRLKEILRDPKLLFNEDKIELLRFVEIVEYAAFLVEQKNKLLASNELYLEFIDEYTMPDEDFSREARELKLEAENLPVMDTSAAMIMLPSEIAGEVNISKFIAKFNSKRDVLINHVNLLQELNARLRVMKVKVIHKLGLLKKQEFKENFESKINDIQMQLVEKEELVIQQKDKISFFNAQLESVRREFALIQDELKITDSKIQELNQKLAGASLDLYEKERVIAEKNKSLRVLEGKLTESTEKLNLIRRIIQEKDQKINEMEKTLVKAHTESARQAVEGNVLSALREDVSGLNSRLNRQQKDSQTQITRLKSELNDWKTKNALLNKSLKEKDADMTKLEENLSINESKIISLRKEKDIEIFKLRAVIQSRDQKIQHFSNRLLAKDKKINELQNIIVIYRDKLRSTQDILDEKLDTLDAIEDQYKRINEKLDETTLNKPPKIRPPVVERPSEFISFHRAGK